MQQASFPVNQLLVRSELTFGPLEYPIGYNFGPWFFPDQRHGLFALIRPMSSRISGWPGRRVSVLPFHKPPRASAIIPGPGRLIPSTIDLTDFYPCISDSGLQVIVPGAMNEGQFREDIGGLTLVAFDHHLQTSSTHTLEIPMDVRQILGRDDALYFMDFRQGVVIVAYLASCETFVLSYGFVGFILLAIFVVSHSFSASTVPDGDSSRIISE
jgi:hypothetical protein